MVSLRLANQYWLRIIRISPPNAYVRLMQTAFLMPEMTFLRLKLQRSATQSEKRGKLWLNAAFSH
jgi:hypothetical protein